jgi:hypothetical protein
MDESERIAKAYLDTLGLGPVQYEPDGNVPPDFLVGGRIAVEVRRFNQNHRSAGRHEGLEEIDIRLSWSMRKLLASFGPPPAGKSCYVCYDFSRPLDWRRTGPRVRRALERVLDAMPSEWTRIPIDTSLTLDVFPASAPTAYAFILGGSSDDQASGYVEAKLIENLRICIDDKTAKVSRFVDRYPEWWLVLVDHTLLRPDADDIVYARGHIAIPDLWQRVVLVDRAEPSKILDVR